MESREVVLQFRLSRRVVVVAAVILALALGVAAVGTVFAQSTTTVINGCVTNKTGALRIVSSSSTCKSGETAISWNQQGPQGLQGQAGADGKTILNGSGAPAADLGSNGDFYIDTSAKDIYGPRNDIAAPKAPAWGSPTSLVGPRGEPGVTYKRTVLVSPVGTPTENGTALRNALSDTTDASESNPYLLKIEPGTYDVGTAYNPLVMKPYVVVEGSGEGVTTITATGGDNYGRATIWGVHHSELRSLTVKNTGGDCNDYEKYLATAIALGQQQGDGTFLMKNVTALASGECDNWAVFTTGGSSITLDETTVATSGTYASSGVGIQAGGNARILNSRITGGTGNVGGTTIMGGGSIRIFASQITGRGVTYNGGSGEALPDAKCAGVYDGDFNFYANTCPINP